jgi:hypothetical protein
MSTEQEIAALRQDVLAAQQRHARAAAGAAQEEAKASVARDDLQAEFGVSTVASAREALAALQLQLDGAAAEVRRQLDLTGGDR